MIKMNKKCQKIKKKEFWEMKSILKEINLKDNKKK